MILKELRKQDNLTQIEISNILGINNKTYCRYELGQNEPDIATLIKIADYFNVTLDYLCERNNNSKYIYNDLSNIERDIINAMLKLNDKNLSRLYGYVFGLLAGQ